MIIFMTTRRRFLQTAGFGMMGLPVAGAVKKSFREAEARLPLSTLQLGIAGYTFLHVPLDGAISMMKRVGVSNLSIKDFYLPLNSQPDVIHAVAGKLQAAGIRIYAAGVIYMKTAAEVDQAFGYARELGVGLIVAAPNPELLPQVEQK